MRVENTVISYLANQGDNVAQRAQRGGQGMNRAPNLHVDTPPLPLLHSVDEGKKRRPWVLSVCPPDLGSSPHVWVVAHLN